MPRNVQLPQERVAQLEGLAEKWNLSVADTIGRLIKSEIDKGTLSADLPGIKVLRKGRTAHLEAGALKLRSARESFLQDAAQQIRDVIEGVSGISREPSEEGLQVIKRGSGIKLQNLHDGTQHVTSPSVALDIAAQIDRAAEEASQS